MGFDQNVFVNCPFDDDYLPLLRPLLFSLVHLGFTPRIALEQIDSGEPRFAKIVALVRESKYAIHDLSRLRANAVGEFSRLNMPFELGLDVGCRLFKAGRWSQKKCLILEVEKYRFHAAISNMSNSDIAAHENQPANVVTEVRNWLVSQTKLRAPGPAAIWGRFNDFMSANYDSLKSRGFTDHDIERLPIPEFLADMQRWVEAN